MRRSRVLLPLLAALVAACWQPPDVPEYTQPPASELLALRPYTLLAPLDADGGTPDGGWPLLVVLHGYQSTGTDTAAYLGLGAEAVRRRYYSLLPPAIGGTWRPAAAPAPPWDSAYVRAAIAEVLAREPIDPRRVFVVGYSQGAHMAHRVGCDGAGLVGAVVAIAGQLLECAPTRPVSVAVVHGTLDRAIPYDGALGALEVASSWSRADGCTGALAATGEVLDLTVADGAETTVQAFGGCPAGVEVQLWTMQGVPHGPEFTGQFPLAVTAFLDAHPAP